MSRNSALLLLALLTAGCDKMTVGNRTEESGDVRVSVPDDTDRNASEAPEGVGTPMAWRVEGAAAFYGAANVPPVFALRCEPASHSILFERAGTGTAINLSAGGVGASLGTRDLGNGRVQARTGMGDAVLDAMARPQSQITVSGGTTMLTIPGGVAVRRIVDFCRNPPPPPAPPLENGMLPADGMAPVAPPVLPTSDPAVRRPDGPALPGSAPAAAPRARPLPAGSRDKAALPTGPAPR
jgi:hypothetical protein